MRIRILIVAIAIVGGWFAFSTMQPDFSRQTSQISNAISSFADGDNTQQFVSLSVGNQLQYACLLPPYSMKDDLEKELKGVVDSYAISDLAVYSNNDHKCPAIVWIANGKVLGIQSITLGHDIDLYVECFPVHSGSLELGLTKRESNGRVFVVLNDPSEER